MTTIPSSLLRSISHQARRSPRQREDCKLPSRSADLQYVLNALQPNTYVRPHRHPRRLFGKEPLECLTLLWGKAGLILMDRSGNIVKRVALDFQAGAVVVEVPSDCYHTLVALQPDTLILETVSRRRKTEYLNAFPTEETHDAQALLGDWKAQFNKT